MHIFGKPVLINSYMSFDVRERTFGHVRTAKIQIRLRFRAVWSESSLDAFWIAKDVKFLHAYNEDSDQLCACAGLSFRRARMSDGTFSDIVVHMTNSLTRIFVGSWRMGSSLLGLFGFLLSAFDRHFNCPQSASLYSIWTKTWLRSEPSDTECIALDLCT